ncbi:MAG: 50S ribosomal protein L21 [Pseudomonadota bacterium]
MYAVIETGGKQYRVAKDQEIAVERLAAEPGAEVSFNQVLMIEGEDGVKVGAPLLDGAKVSGEVVAQSRTRKVIVFKKKRRQNYRRRAGHRQQQTVVKITGITA